MKVIQHSKERENHMKDNKKKTYEVHRNETGMARRLSSYFEIIKRKAGKK